MVFTIVTHQRLCGSKICVLENVQTVNSVYVISVRQKKTVLAIFLLTIFLVVSC